MSNIQAIFFDFDDTLSEQTRFNLQYVRAVGDVLAPRYGGDAEDWAHAAANMFVTLEEDYKARFVGTPLNGYCDWYASLHVRATDLLFGGMNLPQPDDAEAIATETLFRALAGCDALFPGADDAVRLLKARGETLMMASGNDSAHLRAALAGAGIADAFMRFYGPDLIDAAKEGPEFFARIWADCNLLPSSILMIDNDPQQIAWAAQTGARTLQVKLLPGRDIPTAPEADAVLTDWAQLSDFISHLRK